MNLKSLLLLTTVSVLPGTVFATDYYVTPDGAGLKDGSSWENAFGVAEFRTQATTKNTNGDVYYFEGGLYNLSDGTVNFVKDTYATLIGATEGDRTIFSGDKNGNNNPENGDAGRLIRFETSTKNGDTSKPVIVKNIDFTCVFTYCDNDDATMGAFVALNSGDVYLENCQFYNNWAEGLRGGAAAFIMYSKVTFYNCMFYNNSANYRGGAIRIYSNNAEKGIVTLENCVIKNNKNWHNLGGAIFMGHGNSLNIVNSTITGNSAVSDGGAIYFNGYDTSHHRIVRIVNSTIANNTTGANDAQIVSTQDAHISVANSIITCTDDIAAIKFKGTAVGTKFEFVSGGYNYIGSVIEPEGNEMTWADTDTHGAECTYSAIFGENTLNAENVIKPATFILGATGAQVTEAVAEWGLPTGLDLTIDQLGHKRLEDMTTGAYAVLKKDVNTGIDSITSDNEATITKIADGVYAINGTEGLVSVYNLSGTMVKTANADNIDLSTSAAGLYIIRAGNNVFKVIK